MGQPVLFLNLQRDFPGIKIGLRSFEELCPPHVFAVVHGDCEVCMCIVCARMRRIFNAYRAVIAAENPQAPEPAGTRAASAASTRPNAAGPMLDVDDSVILAEVEILPSRAATTTTASAADCVCCTCLSSSQCC